MLWNDILVPHESIYIYIYIYIPTPLSSTTSWSTSIIQYIYRYIIYIYTEWKSPGPTWPIGVKRMSFDPLSIYLSLYLSLYLSIYLSLSIDLSIYLSIDLYIYIYKHEYRINLDSTYAADCYSDTPPRLSPATVLEAMTPDELKVCVESRHFMLALHQVVPSVSVSELKHYETLEKQFSSIS